MGVGAQEQRLREDAAGTDLKARPVASSRGYR